MPEYAYTTAEAEPTAKARRKREVENHPSAFEGGRYQIIGRVYANGERISEQPIELDYFGPNPGSASTY
jgi:hypothetical protein